MLIFLGGLLLVIDWLGALLQGESKRWNLFLRFAVCAFVINFWLFCLLLLLAAWKNIGSIDINVLLHCVKSLHQLSFIEASSWVARSTALWGALLLDHRDFSRFSPFYLHALIGLMVPGLVLPQVFCFYILWIREYRYGKFSIEVAVVLSLKMHCLPFQKIIVKLIIIIYRQLDSHCHSSSWQLEHWL